MTFFDDPYMTIGGTRLGTNADSSCKMRKSKLNCWRIHVDLILNKYINNQKLSALHIGVEHTEIQ
mgnify:FL=1